MPANDLTGIVLAGGLSTRFGADKALALLRGRPMLAHIAEALASVCSSVVIVAAVGQQLPTLGRPVNFVRDAYPALGPLAGMVTGLAATHTELSFVISTDAPLLQPELVRFLADRARRKEADIVCPRLNGNPEPLVSVYRRSACLVPFQAAVERNELKITAAYERLDVLYVDEADLLESDPGLLSFINVNTMSDLAEIQRLLPPGNRVL